MTQSGTALAGIYFASGSSRPIAARASVPDGKTLVVTDDSGAILAQAPFRKIRASPRLAKLRRRLELPDRSHFETDDNDGIDAMLRAAGRLRRGLLIHRLESSLLWAALSLVAAGISIALTITYGFPAAAGWLAARTPRPVLVTISGESLDTMDRVFMSPSNLSATDKHRARGLFARVAAAGTQGRSNYTLLFRDGRVIGPNAFSLPDGRIVMTDQLYRMARSDDELEGVFGHEIAHADRRHVLKMLYEGSLIPAAIALITGDASQFGQIATILPAILIRSSYSRSMEQQADDDSAATMKRIGANPAVLGAFLERLDRKLCGKEGCSQGWLGSHPDAEARAARLRDEARASRH